MEQGETCLTVSATRLTHSMRVGARLRAMGGGRDRRQAGSYVWTRPHCQTCFSTLLPGCIYVSGLFEEAVISFWPTLCELAVCLLHSDLEGQ